MIKSDEQKQDTIQKLVSHLHSKLAKSEAEIIEPFARQYYAGISWDDLANRSVNDLYGAMLSHWKMVSDCEPNEVKVQVYNPNYEQHGWQAGHTVVMVVADNMPFLVDSVRMELNRHNLIMHFLVHFAVNVNCDKEGHTISAEIKKNGGRAKEQSFAPIYLEIDRITDHEMLSHIEASLREVIHDVTLAVSDWQDILKKAREIHQECEQADLTIDQQEQVEATDFIQWMINNNFTFLGCQDVELISGKQSAQMRVVPGSGLGLLREDRLSKTSTTGYLLAERRSDIRITEDHHLIISKSNVKSTVHRPAYMDYIAVKRYDKKGNVIGERRFLGLYTSTAYNSSPKDIPVLRRKVDRVLELSGLPRNGHSGKELQNILESYPRDELFQISEQDLFDISMSILQLQERKQIRLFVRKDIFGRFYTCLVFVPRDRYETELREKFQVILAEAFHATEVEFATVLSESILARTLFTVHVDPQYSVDVDMKEVELKLKEAARTWDDTLKEALVDSFGEEQGNELHHMYATAFPRSYQEDFEARTAVYDIKHIEALSDEHSIGMSLYKPLEASHGEFRFKLFKKGQFVPLTDVLPMLENMGLRVLGEHPYQVMLPEQAVWIHDFRITHETADNFEPEQVKDNFQNAFANLWHGKAENDGFNRLVLGAGLNWRETALLRAYAKYLRQIGFTFSQAYIEDTLANNPGIARMLVEVFKLNFEIDAKKRKENEKAIVEVEKLFFESLDNVANLDQDRILRRYLDIIKATLRTNFFQQTKSKTYKSYISFKMNPRKIPDIPRPCPMFEIFVYSPRVEGVHLRGGKVARGGLRWSDRREDFRTEVLGLVKAQQVKNSVIVPVGAKGGFVPKCLPINGTREEVMTEVIACYSIFIRGLLDITDNLKSGKVIPPKDVVRKDGDDPYLVVAADKGTATFSDIANEIASEYRFWLGDAFASGGSVGYDHKKMGITARGAWESVKRHFREINTDIQSEPFSVVGIGDMAGDVFGNGMLLSKHIKLVAAFNHMHIFIDPEPDIQKSYKERERLFKLPRSSWEDYNQKLISKGGGVFRRSAKSILLTPEIKRLLNLNVDTIEPNHLIRAILRAKVDLLWNGGIGTYVKSKTETDDKVGDRSNDALRINGCELGCKVVGEGGNLGLTQLGRIEAALAGVRVNTDFIDNVGGVDCSDHEVNIKILLNDIVANGDMTEKQRNQLLVEMTDEVSALVLHNNYRQCQSLSVASRRALVRLEHHIRLIHELERKGKLDRELEGLPGDEELKERKVAKCALTVPEISVLLAYTKNVLKEDLIASDLPDDAYYIKALESAFPTVLREKYQTELQHHRLKREIISTQLANNMINKMGASFVLRLTDETGATPAAIVRCYTVARAIFDMSGLWASIEKLDNKVPAETQLEMMLEIMRLIRRATRWFLRNFRKGLDIAAIIDYFTPRMQELNANFLKILPKAQCARIEKVTRKFVEQGVPESLAVRIAYLRPAFPALDIIQAAKEANCKVKTMASFYFGLSDRLNMQWFHEQIAAHVADNHWESLAVAAFRDDFDYQLSALALEVSRFNTKAKNPDERIEHWIQEHKPFVEQWHKMVSESSASPTLEFAMFAVAIRELTDLVQSSRNEELAATTSNQVLAEVKKPSGEKKNKISQKKTGSR